MKKVISVLLAAVMILSLTACGKKREGVKITSASDLSEAAKGDVLLVGVQLGTTGDIYCSDDFGDKHVERFSKGYEAVQALLQGKIDAVVIDDQPAQAFVKQNKGLKILDTEYIQEDYAIAVNKNNTALTAAINDALKTIKADGTFQKIVDYYIGHEDGAKPYEKKDVDRSKGKLVMATNAAFEPYEYRDAAGNIIGLDVDMMQAVCDILGYSLSVEDMEFDSIIAAVVSGQADVGVAGMTVTEDRLKSIDFTDSYYTGRQVIIVNE